MRVCHHLERDCGSPRYLVDGGGVMFVALLMTFSTCDPFNKSVPIVHPRLVCADLKAQCVVFIGIQWQKMEKKICM